LAPAFAQTYGAAGTLAVRYETVKKQSDDPRVTSHVALFKREATAGERLPIAAPIKKDIPPKDEPDERTFRDMTAPYICEFVGTFILVFTFATCVYTSEATRSHHSGGRLQDGNASLHANATKTRGPRHPDNTLVPEGLKEMTWTPMAIGCLVTVLVYASGPVSGGHFNPAISLSCYMARKMSAFRCLSYTLLQLLAGLAAGLIFEIVFLARVPSIAPLANGFGQAAAIEILFTTMLCFVVLNVSTSKRNNPENHRNQFFALAIGFVIIAAGYAGGNISGAVLNPAISLGLDWDAIHGGWAFQYAIVELVGGLLAALLFRLCRAEDFQEASIFPDGQVANDVSLYVPPLPVRMFSELLGTFFLVLVVGLSITMLSPATALSAGVALSSMIYALGDVSGGYFNPAVTLAIVLSGRDKCSYRDGGYYVLSQLLGAAFASMVMTSAHHHGPTADMHFGLLGSSNNYNWGAVVSVEILFTSFLCWVVLAVATSDKYTVQRGNFYFALAIGFSVLVGAYASGTISGGYLNPAVAFGIAIEGCPDFSSNAKVEDAGISWPSFTDNILQAIAIFCQIIAYFMIWIEYVICELIGALLAVLVFRFTHPAEYRPNDLMPFWSSEESKSVPKGV
jgi:aquaporin Z